ncbi:bZIP transcription factor bZIP-1 [Penicillium sp. DV-2018c]|nr:bZIP transcription factor bZIP-1 [Penicillium sp. DV-2018c]KAJ5565557.1 bZIP transcription factor bZIP-1 [Penicillium sp. DV-2018c]
MLERSGKVIRAPSGSYDNAHASNFALGDDESPFLDFTPELDFDYPSSANLIGDLPGSSAYDIGEKRKSLDGKSALEAEETGKKRRESEAKKPGRKPLTSEPTTKRKAQNRAAQRAFRERKEKHLKDLEDSVERLRKTSEMANQENGLLRAQVERLQVELREYRKRLSWMSSGNGLSALSSNSIPNAHSKGAFGLQNNEFLFDFPKFGDLPGGHLFNGQSNKNDQKSNDNLTRAPGVLSRDSLNRSSSRSNSHPASNHSQFNGTPHSVTSTRASYSGFKPSTNDNSTSENSPSSSSDSHQSHMASSSGTSPEPSVNSPDGKYRELGVGDSCGGHITSDGEKSFCEQLGMACGNIINPVPAVRDGKSKSHSISSSQPTPIDNQAEGDGSNDLGIDWMVNQNGGQFDPVLFGDWREPQDAVLSQDFGSFFNEAFPLPDLGSPSHNLSEVASDTIPPKKSLVAQIDSRLDDDEVVPGEDQTQMLSCTKIWDRLQSMEKFRNGEIDVDNLCSELRTKARCSEGGVVVNQSDVDDIMGRVK